jgi:hypothetical protein
MEPKVEVDDFLDPIPVPSLIAPIDVKSVESEISEATELLNDSD